MLPNNNEIKPQINDRKISRKPPNTLKLNNMLLNNPKVKKKVAGKIKKIFLNTLKILFNKK